MRPTTKIFLGNSPWSTDNGYGVRAGSRWPHIEPWDSLYVPFPFFLSYAASVLEYRGYALRLLDGIAQQLSADEFVQEIATFAPEWIVLEVSTPSWSVDLAMIRCIRSQVGGKAKIVLCGLHTYQDAGEFLFDHSEVDYVIRGEYEMSLAALVDAVVAGESGEDVPGVAGRAGDSIFVSPQGGILANLDQLPWPLRRQLPMQRYCDNPYDIPLPNLQVLASRGCPYGCVFCAWPQIMYGGRTYRRRNAKDVVDEIQWALAEFGCKSFYFDDDTFNVDSEYVIALCQEIKSRKIALPWAAMARPDLMNERLLRHMKEAGIYAIKYGVESANPEVLAQCNKELDIAVAAKNIKLTKDMGIKVHLTFMFGLPGETHATARQTIDFALDMNPHSVQFSIATPFPGSRFYQLLEQQGMLADTAWDRYDGLSQAVIRTEALSSDEIQVWLKRAYAEWNGWAG